MRNMSTSDLVFGGLSKVQRWVEEHDYKGYEPFDGLSSWVRPLTFGKLLPERLLMQLVRQSPINLRPMLGIRPQDSTKGRGYMASGYIHLYRATGQDVYLTQARKCLEWLDTHKVQKFKHHAWSNHFDFVGRGGGYGSQDPIIVWTSLIGHAYLDAFEATDDPWFLTIAGSACRWILELPRERTTNGDCLSYLTSGQSSIHNANMLGAGCLARYARHTGDRESRDVARSAMLYSCSRQLPDGSWWYAEAEKYHWIDNFHTGYNLDSLKHYIDCTGDQTWSDALARGLAFYKEHFFEDNGCPKYYHTRRYPVDIQCAAQSIDTFALFSEKDPECLDLAIKVARWTMSNMQARDGHFHYRHYPWGKAKTAMLHWGQATMFKGLAVLYRRLCADARPEAAPRGS